MLVAELRHLTDECALRAEKDSSVRRAGLYMAMVDAMKGMIERTGGQCRMFSITQFAMQSPDGAPSADTPRFNADVNYLVEHAEADGLKADVDMMEGRVYALASW